MTESAAWDEANARLIAKAIGELTFEGLLAPSETESAGFELSMQSGARYTFNGWRTVWTHLRVEPASVRRNSCTLPLSAAQFFLDAKAELEISDLTLGTFLEEMQSTLVADAELLRKNRSKDVAWLANQSGNEIQSYLNGHPKVLLNKGRMGFSADDRARFSPESAAPFQLRYSAIERSRIQISTGETLDPEFLFQMSLRPAEQSFFGDRIRARGKDPANFVIVPTHPWQWERVLTQQFAGEIARGELIDLGIGGDYYRPQISIRTLANVTHPEMPDVKLPLTILNTSAVRGISARSIQNGPALSAALRRICEQDSRLRSAETQTLEDLGGFSCLQPDFAAVAGAPYRYHETFGAIWRQSTPGQLGDRAPGTDAILTGSLFHQDEAGKSLMGEYIRKSGVPTEAWLRVYFERAVLPLYHLQRKYGVGLVAHGQNIVLKLRDHAPVGIYLKDFHGDLRLTTEVCEAEKFSPAFSTLDRLKPEHLIHDLLTGHFLTVLRFASAALEMDSGFPERAFYRIGGDVIRDYHRQEDLPEQSPASLLNPTVPRVILNAVRFKLGYGDSAERPRPLVGAPLPNPLAIGESP